MEEVRRHLWRCFSSSLGPGGNCVGRVSQPISLCSAARERALVVLRLVPFAGWLACTLCATRALKDKDVSLGVGPPWQLGFAFCRSCVRSGGLLWRRL